MLTAFIVLQIILDLEVVLFLLLWHRRRKRAAAARVGAPRAAEPPAWYREFLLLAEDVLTLVEPVLDALEKGKVPAAAVASATSAPSGVAVAPSAPSRVEALRDRHREAFALLRGGTPVDEVARRERLSPGEARLIENLVAAEYRLTEARPPAARAAEARDTEPRGAEPRQTEAESIGARPTGSRRADGDLGEAAPEPPSMPGRHDVPGTGRTPRPERKRKAATAETSTTARRGTPLAPQAT